jgi:hypothetical protein
MNSHFAAPAALHVLPCTGLAKSAGCKSLPFCSTKTGVPRPAPDTDT